MNDGDLGIWSTLSKNVLVSIPLVIFLGSPLIGSTDRGQCFRVSGRSSHDCEFHSVLILDRLRETGTCMIASESLVGRSIYFKKGIYIVFVKYLKFLVTS